MTVVVANVQNNVGQRAGIISAPKTLNNKNEKVFVMKGAEERINKAKADLLAEVKKHFDNLSAETEERFKMLLKRLDERLKDCEVPGVRKKLMQERKNVERQSRFSKKQLKQHLDEYMRILEDYTIVSSREVVYNGESFERNEPIRRLTKNHLDFLREVNSGLNASPSMHKALQDYTDEVEGFLHFIKNLN